MIRRCVAGGALMITLAACANRPRPVLDRQAVLERQTWWDNRDWSWYLSEIPFFESPDSDIDATYYYRWELVTKHLTYGSPQTGYTFTEFLDRPFWSGRFGAISCPLGHQFSEIRWLKDRRIVDDYARYWFETPGAQPRSYSNWYGDAMWATYLVSGDRNFLEMVYPYMERQYAGWMQERFDSAQGLFHWYGIWDGMEANIDSRQTADPVDGGDGYRPTLNSYMYGDALAIADAAAVLGDSATATQYRERAAALKARVQQDLWDPRREFFLNEFVHDEAGGIRAKTRTYETGRYAGSPHGRELLGYVPWQFDLPDSGYESAWRFLMDPDYFFAPYGPTTAERHDPLFLISPTCCVWSGNSWPYATTQTLVAMANLLNDYHQAVVTPEDYYRLLRVYTLTQRRDGRPYIAEAANPDNDSWEGHNTFYHSEHYFHSGYVDLIITGLVGLRPRADDTLEVNPLAPRDWPYFALDGVRYHGHDVSIVWDRSGARYGLGAGLVVLVDGREAGRSPTIGRLRVPISAPRAAPAPDRPHDFAVNEGGHAYPLVTASYSDPSAPPTFAVDGNYWYHESPPNRWTTAGSPNADDWIEVDFGIERPIESVKLYILDDGRGIVPPARYEIEQWTDGAWVPVRGQRRDPVTPMGHHANVVTFPTVRTPRIRVVFTHAAGGRTGLTEIETWGHASLPLPEATAPARDIAFRPPGAAYPVVSASFTAPNDRVEDVNDMVVAFSRYSRNRWTAYGSPNRRDWVAVAFAAPRRVSVLDLYLWGDGRGVKAPTSIAVQYWDGSAWRDATIESRDPDTPVVWARNRVRIAPVETARVRIVFEHDLPAYSGMTEVMIWE
jgi:hypothetical protein